MAQILLVGFDDTFAKLVADMLQRRGHRVTIQPGAHPLSAVLRNDSQSFDLVVLDVSPADAVAGKHLAAVSAHRQRYGPRPMLLCVSRVCRGAQFELDLERKGARVVYVR